MSAGTHEVRDARGPMGVLGPEVRTPLREASTLNCCIISSATELLFSIDNLF